MGASGSRCYLGLCAIAKDETPFLREWVAYHHLIGFERIFIYDNDSGTPVRDTVADMYESDMVETYTIPGAQRQLVAYNHCLRHHGRECEWLAFLDLDEFLVLRGENDARIFCGGYEAYAGIVVNWNVFSSSGHLARPAGLVMENYRESLGPDVTVKSIVRPAVTDKPLSPHHFIFRSGFAVTTDGIPVAGGYAPIATDKAVVNHYIYRSQQDYEDKMRRGDAIFVDFDPRSLDLFYAQAAKETRTDEAILRHAPRVKGIMETGIPAPYHILNTEEALAEPYWTSLARMASAFEEGNPGLARLIFYLGRSRFAHEANYLRLGCKICQACQDGPGARRAALDLLALDTSLSSYLELFRAGLVCGDTAETARLSSFIAGRAAETGDRHAVEALRAAQEESGSLRK